MTLSELGKQYICQNFGDTSFCCVKTGLSWYYTVAGTNYNETGGTAQIVSRFASGLIASLTMTSPARGAFTKAELDAANGSTVTLQDAKEITYHDESTEDQWCFIPCEAHTDQDTCENIYLCHWWNNGCHTNLPSCDELDNQSDCESYGCFWYNESCHDAAPSCEALNNGLDCSRFGCYWFRGVCHSVDQPELCYWIDTQGGPEALTVPNVFTIIDAYIYNTPPTGYTFIPTIVNTFGIIDYYLGFNGDPKTGCLYY